MLDAWVRELAVFPVGWVLVHLMCSLRMVISYILIIGDPFVTIPFVFLPRIFKNLSSQTLSIHTKWQRMCKNTHTHNLSLSPSSQSPCRWTSNSNAALSKGDFLTTNLQSDLSHHLDLDVWGGRCFIKVQNKKIGLILCSLVSLSLILSSSLWDIHKCISNLVKFKWAEFIM